MADSAYPAGIVLLIVKWELMSDGMPREVKILSDPPALDAGYVLLSVHGVS